MKYTLLNNTDFAFQIWPTASEADQPYKNKLTPKSYAHGNKIIGVWLETSVKIKGKPDNVIGYIDTRLGDLTINDDSPTPEPTPRADLVLIRGYFDTFGMDYVERRGIELGKEEVYAGIQGLPAAIKFYNQEQVNITEGTLARAFLSKIFSAGAPSYMTIAEKKDREKKLLKEGVGFTDRAANRGWNQVATASIIAHSMGDPVKKPGNKWPPLNLWRPIRVLQIGSMAHMERQAADYPYTIIEAKTSNRSFGGRGIGPFPQLDDYPVRVPMLCKDTVNFIPEIFVRELKAGEPLPELYYPPRS